MNYYFIGVKYQDNQELTQKMNLLREEVQSALGIKYAGKLYIPENTNILENEKFNKLLNILNPQDCLVIFDLVQCATNIAEAVNLFNTLNNNQLNFIDLVCSSLNTLDTNDTYSEITDNLLLVYKYAKFLYTLAKGELTSEIWYTSILLQDINFKYTHYIRRVLLKEIKNYLNNYPVDDFFRYINSENIKSPLKDLNDKLYKTTLSDTFESINLFNSTLIQS